MLQIKLQRIEGRDERIKNPGRHLRKLQQLDPKDCVQGKAKSIDMIQRPIIITLYLVLIGFVVFFSKMIFGQVFSVILEVFLYSVLNSYYCYDYKASLLEIDTEMSLELFERQWVYFFGFGFPFTVFMYMMKDVGSSLYFLFFPFMIVLSMDEQG